VNWLIFLLAAIPPRKAGISRYKDFSIRYQEYLYELQSRLEKQAFQVWLSLPEMAANLPAAIPPRKAGISRNGGKTNE